MGPFEGGRGEQAFSLSLQYLGRFEILATTCERLSGDGEAGGST